MKRMVLVLLIFGFMSGCAAQTNNQELTFSVSSEGYLVVNGNVTSVRIRPFDGIDGQDGVDGQNGRDGLDGQDGRDGDTPFIGTNGHWWISNQDTGIVASLYPKGLNSTTFINLEPHSQQRFPLRIDHGTPIVINNAVVSTRYANFNEFLQLNSLQNSKFEATGFQTYEVRVGISGSVPLNQAGNMIAVIIMIGSEPISLFDTIASDGSFILETTTFINTMVHRYVISNVIVFD